MKHQNKFLPAIFSKYHVNACKVCLLSNWKICFHVFKLRTYDELLCFLENIIKLFKERPLLTSKVDISKLQKQLRSVIQIHMKQSASFGPLSLNVRDSKPQHRWLKRTRNATNRHKHINEASK